MEPITRPVSPASLLACLRELVPAFSAHWADDYPNENEPSTYHRVMHAFTYSFGLAASSLNEHQLGGLGALVNASVSVSDDLENAVSTCFLEHLHQIGARDILWPYLSPTARAECHA